MDIIKQYYINRIKKYNKIINTLRNYKKKQLLKEKNNRFTKLGDNIILDNIIGKGKTGTVYNGYFISDDKLLFAIKIANNDKSTMTEINILKKITKYTLNTNFPHFPVYYGYFKSMNTNNLMLLNELQDNNFKYFYTNISRDNPKLLFNSICQNIISLIYYYNITKKYHRDSHSNNFLYYKIPSKGCFHYKIYNNDYYLENLGYVFLIWDYQYSRNIKNSNIPVIKDYTRILKSLIKLQNKHLSDFINDFSNILTRYKHKTGKKNLDNLNKRILLLLNIYISTFTTSSTCTIINNNI
jgi:hypothetical protein